MSGNSLCSKRGHQLILLYNTLCDIFLAVSIAIMDVSYRKIAVWLTDLENHRLEDDYNNYYVIKLILLQFVNSFYSLFYTAFYLKDLDLLRKVNFSY
ncbi:unnamed protein product [Trichobilharzia regenti]|nr:unnamed protein product [Trichobilharzia regenti]